MAKVKKEEVRAYPSDFGSHAVMIHEGKTAELNDPKLVVLKDEFGYYTTFRNRLDNREADPNRYVESRLSKLFAKKKEKD